MFMTKSLESQNNKEWIMKMVQETTDILKWDKNLKLKKSSDEVGKEVITKKTLRKSQREVKNKEKIYEKQKEIISKLQKIYPDAYFLEDKFDDNWFIQFVNQYWGIPNHRQRWLMTINGDILISPRYKRIGAFHDWVVIVETNDSPPKKWVINIKWEILFAAEYYKINDFNDWLSIAIAERNGDNIILTSDWQEIYIKYGQSIEFTNDWKKYRAYESSEGHSDYAIIRFWLIEPDWTQLPLNNIPGRLE